MFCVVNSFAYCFLAQLWIVPSGAYIKDADRYAVYFNYRAIGILDENKEFIYFISNKIINTPAGKSGFHSRICGFKLLDKNTDESKRYLKLDNNERIPLSSFRCGFSKVKESNRFKRYPPDIWDHIKSNPWHLTSMTLQPEETKVNSLSIDLEILDNFDTKAILSIMPFNGRISDKYLYFGLQHNMHIGFSRSKPSYDIGPGFVFRTFATSDYERVKIPEDCFSLQEVSKDQFGENIQIKKPFLWGQGGYRFQIFSRNSDQNNTEISVQLVDFQTNVTHMMGSVTIPCKIWEIAQGDFLGPFVEVCSPEWMEIKDIPRLRYIFSNLKLNNNPIKFKGFLAHTNHNVPQVGNVTRFDEWIKKNKLSDEVLKRIVVNDFTNVHEIGPDILRDKPLRKLLYPKD
jgi:hypothetical protein